MISKSSTVLDFSLHEQPLNLRWNWKYESTSGFFSNAPVVWCLLWASDGQLDSVRLSDQFISALLLFFVCNCFGGEM